MSDDAKPVMRQDASTGEVVEDKAATEEAKNNVDPKKPTMHIKVYAPFQIFFDDEAYSISAINETGPFDILPHHHNFICMLVPCELVLKTPYEVKRIKVSRALMHVKAEMVTVFVDV
jgi:F0F1-type ATP synthase epsilon subunit